MARGIKVVVALGLTLALHAVVAIYALGPRLSGLARQTAETSGVANAVPPEAVAVSETAKPSHADQKVAANAEPPLEVSLVQTPPDASAPPEQKPETPVQVEKPPEPVAEKPAAEKPASKPVTAKPEEKPVEKIAAKPTVNKPAEKPVDQKAALLAAKAAEAAQKAAAKTAAAKPATAGKPPAATGTAVSPVLSADSGYANRVRQHLAKFAGALPPGAVGEARVQFVVQPDGRVTDVHLVKFSGNTGLDTVALKLPTEAQPLPLPGATAQRLEVPVQATSANPLKLPG